jgi:hypothetical protein
LDNKVVTAKDLIQAGRLQGIYETLDNIDHGMSKYCSKHYPNGAIPPNEVTAVVSHLVAGMQIIEDTAIAQAKESPIVNTALLGAELEKIKVDVTAAIKGEADNDGNDKDADK